MSAKDGWRDSPNYLGGSARRQEIQQQAQQEAWKKKAERMYNQPAPRGSDPLGAPKQPTTPKPYFSRRPDSAPSYDWYKRKANALPNDQWNKSPANPYNRGGTGGNPPKSPGLGGRWPGRGGATPNPMPGSPNSPIATNPVTKIPTLPTLGGALRGLGILGSAASLGDSLIKAGEALRNQGMAIGNLNAELQGQPLPFKRADFEKPWNPLEWLFPENGADNRTTKEPPNLEDPNNGIQPSYQGLPGKYYWIDYAGTDYRKTSDGQVTEAPSNGRFPFQFLAPLFFYVISTNVGGVKETGLTVRDANGRVEGIRGTRSDSSGNVRISKTAITLVPVEPTYPPIEPDIHPVSTPYIWFPIPGGAAPVNPKKPSDPNKKGTNDKGDDWTLPAISIPFITGRGSGVPSGETPTGAAKTPSKERQEIPARAPTPSPEFYSPGTAMPGSPSSPGTGNTGTTGGTTTGTGTSGTSSGSVGGATPAPVPVPTDNKEDKKKDGFDPLNPFPIPIIPIPGRATGTGTGTGTPTGGSTGTGTDTQKPSVCLYDSKNISGGVDRANFTLNAVQAFQQNQIMGKLNTIDSKLGAQLPDGIAGRLVKVGRFLGIDRILNVMSFLAVLHNAFMLSSMIPTTLFSAIDTAALLFDNDPNDEPLDSSKVVGSAIQSFFESTFGVEATGGAKHIWNKFNRILSAAANVLYTLQSIAWSIFEILETMSSWLAQVGNVLEKWGVIGEETMRFLNPNVNYNYFKWMTRINAVQEVVEAIEQIASELVEVKEQSEQLATQTAELQKAVLGNDPVTGSGIDKPPPPNHRPTAKASSDENNYSKSPVIQGVDLIRPEPTA